MNIGEGVAQPLSSIMPILRPHNDHAAWIAFAFGFVAAAPIVTAFALVEQDSARAKRRHADEGPASCHKY